MNRSCGRPVDQLAVPDESLGPVAQHVDQARSPPIQLGTTGRGQIVQLRRILVEVEELLPAGLRVPDVLAVAVGQVVLAQVVGVLAGVLAVQVLAHGRRLSAHDRQHAPAGHRVRNRRAGDGQDGRHQVLQPDRRRRYHAGAERIALRATDDERHARRPLVRPTLAEHVVVAEHLAVVGGEQEHRVGQLRLHHLQQPADLVVDEVDHPVVGRLAAAPVVLVQVDVPSVGIDALARHRPTRHVQRPVAHRRRRQVAVDVAVVVVARRRERRVRVDERQVEKERLRVVAVLQEVDGPVDHPEGVQQLLRQVVGPAHPGVGRDPVRIAGVLVAHAAVGQPLGVVARVAAVGDLHVLEPVAPAARSAAAHVALADHFGLVAGGGQLAGQQVRRRPVGVPAHADRAVGRRRRAAHHGAPRRHAARALGVGAREARPRGGQPVQVRRLQHRVALDAQGVAALLVGQDQNDVGSITRHGEWNCSSFA